MRPKGSARRLALRLLVTLVCLVLPARAGAESGTLRILVVGDSLATGLAAGMGGVLGRGGRSGTGAAAVVEKLVNIGAGVIPRAGFDFTGALERRLRDRARPVDIVVLMLGTNDVGMPLGRGPFYGEDWSRLYRERLTALVRVPVSRDIPTFWVGLPALGNRAFADPVAQHIRPLQEDVLDDPASGVTLIPTAALTAADGAQAAAAAVGRPRPRRFRAADGVHFTGEGYLYLGAYVLAEIERALPVRLAPDRN